MRLIRPLGALPGVDKLPGAKVNIGPLASPLRPPALAVEVPEGFQATDKPFSHLNIFGTPEALPGDIEPGLAKTPR